MRRGGRVVQLGMADGSVTLGQLAPDALPRLGWMNPATAEGSLLAVPRGTQPPPGYALYKSSDRNGSLVKSKSSDECGKIIVVKHMDRVRFMRWHQATGPFRICLSVMMLKPMVGILPNLAEALHGVSVFLGEKIYVIGGENESSQVRSDFRVYDQTDTKLNNPNLPNKRG